LNDPIVSLRIARGKRPVVAEAGIVDQKVDVDLCRKSQIDDLIAWLDQNKINIDFLINNAGLGDYGSFAAAIRSETIGSFK